MTMMSGVVRQRCGRVGGWDEVMVRGDNLMVVMLTDLMVMIMHLHGDANDDHLRRVRPGHLWYLIRYVSLSHSVSKLQDSSFPGKAESSHETESGVFELSSASYGEDVSLLSWLLPFHTNQNIGFGCGAIYDDESTKTYGLRSNVSGYGTCWGWENASMALGMFRTACSR